MTCKQCGDTTCCCAEYTRHGVESCKGCGEDVPLNARLNKRLYDTGYCEDCRETCAICDDPMLGAADMRTAQGERVHCVCFAAQILEMPIMEGAR